MRGAGGRMHTAHHDEAGHKGQACHDDGARERCNKQLLSAPFHPCMHVLRSQAPSQQPVHACAAQSAPSQHPVPHLSHRALCCDRCDDDRA
jgi:hypothetical protein